MHYIQGPEKDYICLESVNKTLTYLKVSLVYSLAANSGDTLITSGDEGSRVVGYVRKAHHFLGDNVTCLKLT